MATISETRDITVKYGREDQYIHNFSSFGWRCVSKKLLNRFGNPLPLGEKVSEDDLREKCSYQLTFKREVDESVVAELDALQAQYEDEQLLDTSFGKGRITGSVFLTIGFISCIAAIATGHLTTGALMVMIFFASFTFLGNAAIIATGIVRVVNANKKNAKIRDKQDEILDRARRLLK